MKKLIVLCVLLICHVGTTYAQVLRTPDGKMLKIFNDTQSLNIHLDSLNKSGYFSGIVVIAESGKITYKYIGGVANQESQKPLTLESRFNMASVTKMFTGVAVMQLVEQGKLSLDDSIYGFFPDFPNTEWAKKATVKGLLTHTSGLGDYLPFNKGIKNLLDLDQIVQNIYQNAQIEMPDNQMKYSNAGFYLLGKIIEKVSKQSYFQFVETNILKPAAMQNTVFSNEGSSDLYVTGYRLHKNTGKFQSNEKEIIPIGGPAGGAFTSVSDMIAFFEALSTHKLLKKETIEKMCKIQTEGRRGMGYGLGIGAGITPNGVAWVGHNGGAPGINNDVTYYPHSKKLAIVFLNKETPENMPLMMNIKLMTSK